VKIDLFFPKTFTVKISNKVSARQHNTKQNKTKRKDCSHLHLEIDQPPKLLELWKIL